MPPVMLDTPRRDGGVIYHCKTHLNIDRAYISENCNSTLILLCHPTIGGCTCDVTGASQGASDVMTVSQLILVIEPCKFQQLQPYMCSICVFFSDFSDDS